MEEAKFFFKRSFLLHHDNSNYPSKLLNPKKYNMRENTKAIKLEIISIKIKDILLISYFLHFYHTVMLKPKLLCVLS